MDESWYDFVQDKSLEQGDILLNIPTLKIRSYSSALNEEDPLDEYIFDFIVLNQTCDLEHNKIREILVASIQPYNEFCELSSSPFFSEKRWRTSLRKNNEPAFMVFPSFNTNMKSIEYPIISFRNVQSIPTTYIQEFIDVNVKRPRLKSPYKEYLGNSFGNFFTRVALPNTISEDFDNLSKKDK